MTYNSANYTWKTTSLVMPYSSLDLNQDDLNLALETTNGKWACNVELDPNPSPTYEFVRCSRKVPEQNDYVAQEIRYQPLIVVYAIGYKYYGLETDFSEWVWGGLITMENATYFSASMAVLSATFALSMF